MLYLVMGVTGSGKTTIGEALAERLDLPFYDADRFHPPENRAKIGRDQALNDDDRWPWLERIAGHVPRWEARGGAVLACSALKQAYRNILVGAAKQHRLIVLEIPREVVRSRLERRRGHHDIVREFDGIIEGQFRDLEPPPGAITVSALLPPADIVEHIHQVLREEGHLSQRWSEPARRLRIAEGSPSSIIDEAAATRLVDELVAGLGSPRRVLLVPPDYSRIHSQAGELTVAIYERLTLARCHVEILPAIGTHAPMTADELGRMFPGIPADRFAVHDFRNGVTNLGEVPASFVRDVSEGKLDYPIRCDVSSRLVDGSWDRIISIGQLVPHEVIGIANHNKNIFVGTGGKDVIDKTHYLGAVCNMERIMGRIQSPVREILNYMSCEFGPKLPPVTYVLTVRQPQADGAVVTRGIYAGDDEGCYFVGAKLCRQVNIHVVEQPLRKVVAYLDPAEFRSTWIGNKAIYRTRMALADDAELVILAPGVDKFGEDPALDRLIRRHGYKGTPHVLAAVQRDPELAQSLSGAAHLIHGSSEGRFKITYASRGLGKDDMTEVGFSHVDYATAIRRYDPDKLRDGFNRLADGEEIFYISNPALGLWAARPAAAP